MRYIRTFFLNLSRFFLSAVFLAGAVKNIVHWHETEKNIMSTLAEWQSYVDFSQDAQIFFSIVIPWTSLLQIAATLLLLSGGLLLLLGIREKLAASLLVLFLVPVTILYHPFWWTDGVGYELQAVMFLKNLAILGCLMQILVRKGEAKAKFIFEEKSTLPPMNGF